MTSAMIKSPYKATKFLFKGMKKSDGPPGFQKGHVVFLRINQIAGKCKKIGWVAHPVSAVTTCFEKYILEGLKSQTVQGCFQNFLKNHFLSELFWRVLPCWCRHSVGDPADYHDLVVWGQVLGLRLKIDNADLKNNVKISFSNKLSKYSYC